MDEKEGYAPEPESLSFDDEIYDEALESLEPLELPEPLYADGAPDALSDTFGSGDPDIILEKMREQIRDFEKKGEK